MKNKFMRLASVMLVLTLLTTCGVSGTYAKYMTTASASDTAQVAKFGVVITTWGNSSLFKNEYTSHTEAYEGATVIGAQTEVLKKVVAPGTSNDGETSFSITGTPEVAVQVTYSVTPQEVNGVKQEVCVPPGEYHDWTNTTPGTPTFTISDPYYPVRFTLKHNGTEVKTGTLAEINAKLSELSATYPPNTDLSDAQNGAGKYTLSWTWAFTGQGYTDKLDTLLGQKANGVVETNANVVTSLAFDLNVTVTQID